MPTYPPSQVGGYKYNQPSTFIEKQLSFDRERYQDDDDNKRCIGSGCVTKCCLIILVLLILASVIILLAGAIFRPRLPEIQLTTLSVTNFKLVENSMSGNWDIAFSIKNPNSKMSLEYEKATLTLLYDTYTLVDTTLNPFTQEKKGETALKGSMAISDKIIESKVVEELNEERKNVGSVEFDVKLVVPMSFDARIYKTNSKEVKVHCKDMVVLLAENWPNGSLSDAINKQCRVSF